MKRICLSLVSICIYAMGFSQSCPDFTPGSNISKIAPGLYKLTVYYSGNGEKHLDVALFEGPTIVTNLLSTTCMPAHGVGFASIDFTSTGNDPRAIITPGSGNCGGGNNCEDKALTISYAAAGPLPVLIESFYAKRNNSVVTLTWKTLSEINAKEFIVQKNTGNGFIDTRTVTAYNRANGASYMITDNDISKATTLYRIKMVDFDGTFTNSDTRTVKGTGTNADYTVFPNPATANSNVSISDISGPTDIQLIDNTGRVIKNVSLKNNKLDLKSVQTGLYQIRIYNRASNTVVTRKLTVVN